MATFVQTLNEQITHRARVSAHACQQPGSGGAPGHPGHRPLHVQTDDRLLEVPGVPDLEHGVAKTRQSEVTAGVHSHPGGGPGVGAAGRLVGVAGVVKSRTKTHLFFYSLCQARVRTPMSKPKGPSDLSHLG